ncbi:MAG: hypothetical protein IK062_08680 [Selenomonadaceae bacterium]|nr:hypothetical protein [Selenomonadaceae bacterium]
MEEKVSLQILMTDTNNNLLKKNIGYVNPNATDEQLYELATKFVNLTTNTFVSVDKIVQSSIDINNDEDGE